MWQALNTYLYQQKELENRGDSQDNTNKRAEYKYPSKNFTHGWKMRKTEEHPPSKE